MKKFFRNHKWQLTTLSLLAIIALLASMITFSPSAIVKKQWGNVITIGSEVSASTTADFTATGTAAQQTATFQTALNDLPSSGGILNILSGTFTFNATVTRAIANVTIEGIGMSTIFTNNASTPIFTAGGNGWNFEGFVTDAGGVSVGSYIYFVNNVTIASTLIGMANSGTATITSGNTSIVVNHGLLSTPTSVQITLANDPTSNPGVCWVSTITSTQFTINCVTNPSTSGAIFYWRAVVGNGN